MLVRVVSRRLRRARNDAIPCLPSASDLPADLYPQFVADLANVYNQYGIALLDTGDTAGVASHQRAAVLQPDFAM